MTSLQLCLDNDHVCVKECGADCVKLQMSSLPAKFNRCALSRPYMSEHAWADTYGDHKKRLEFSQEQFVQLQEYAMQLDIPLTASAMDIVSHSHLCKAAFIYCSQTPQSVHPSLILPPSCTYFPFTNIPAVCPPSSSLLLP